MGEGKTEAALAAVEVLAARFGAGGVFFGLPTMATGNAMFRRPRDWLDRLPAPEGARYSVQLAHSKAARNDDFADLMGKGRRIAAVDVDGFEEHDWRPTSRNRFAAAELVAHAWSPSR
ncbi:hypothetical protein [Streptomyces sp. NRRL S-813]|uniref:hypothetical protein n=1 Tax=Streptomyces sp. NRRL S-813 TaxID=1463919 RepID=UPI0004BF51F5